MCKAIDISVADFLEELAEDPAGVLDEDPTEVLDDIVATHVLELKVYPEFHVIHPQPGPLEYVAQYVTRQSVTVSLINF